MKNLVWLASYPKSGNTWFRIVLGNLLSATSGKQLDINQIGVGAIASSRLSFDQQMGLKASDLSLGQIQAWRVKVAEAIAQQHEPELFFFKIHDHFQQFSGRDALIPLDKTRCVIYFVRNPLDVCVSYAHHFHVAFQDASQQLCDVNWGLCAEPTRLYNQLHQHLSSWSEHVRSWLDAPGVPIHLLRYEDMKRDSFQSFANALVAAGVAFTDEQLRQALEASKLEKLRHQEEETGFFEKIRTSPAPFFRKGAIGDGKAELSQEQILALVTHHGAMMRRLGYLDQAGTLLF